MKPNNLWLFSLCLFISFGCGKVAKRTEDSALKLPKFKLLSVTADSLLSEFIKSELDPSFIEVVITENNSDSTCFLVRVVPSSYLKEKKFNYASLFKREGAIIILNSGLNDKVIYNPGSNLYLDSIRNTGSGPFLFHSKLLRICLGNDSTWYKKGPSVSVHPSSPSIIDTIAPPK